jgi:membrane-associated phospholipid phosphatase
MHRRIHAAALITMFCAALLLWALTCHVLANAGSLAADAYWTDAVRALQSKRMSTFMQALHALQGKLVAASIVAWAATLAWRRQWNSLLLFAAAVPGGMLANVVLKMLVERPRPALPAAIGSHGFAYPSGHVAAITLCCGYIVLETFRRTTKTSWRIAVSAAAVVTVALVAVSRVYLGVHQPSDGVAAVLLGVVWLGACAQLRPSAHAWLGARRS